MIKYPEGHPKRRPDPGKKAGSPARDATDFSGRKLSGLDPSGLQVDGLVDTRFLRKLALPPVVQGSAATFSAAI